MCGITLLWRQYEEVWGASTQMCFIHTVIKHDVNIPQSQTLWVNSHQAYSIVLSSGPAKKNETRTSLEACGLEINIIKLCCQIAFGSDECATIHKSLAVLHTRPGFLSFFRLKQTHTDARVHRTTNHNITDTNTCTDKSTLRPPGRSVYWLRQRPHGKQTLLLFHVKHQRSK